MSEIATGNAAEQLARRTLERDGLAVWVARRSLVGAPGRMRAFGNDVFGDYDLIALGPDTTRLIQVKATPRKPDAAWVARVEGRPIGGRDTSHEWWSLHDRDATWRIWLWMAGAGCWLEERRAV